MNDAIKTQLSAFVDGELSDAESELLVRRLSRDPELRNLIADYQSIGRAMRDETTISTDGLLERVRSAIDGDIVEVPAADVQTPKRGLRNPFAGVAAAAAVALVAILGVGQIGGGTAEPVADQPYTVPTVPASQDVINMLGQTGSGLNTRMAGWQLVEESLETPADDSDPADDEQDDAQTE